MMYRTGTELGLFPTLPPSYDDAAKLHVIRCPGHYYDAETDLHYTNRFDGVVVTPQSIDPDF